MSVCLDLAKIAGIVACLVATWVVVRYLAAKLGGASKIIVFLIALIALMAASWVANLGWPQIRLVIAVDAVLLAGDGFYRVAAWAIGEMYCVMRRRASWKLFGVIVLLIFLGPPALDWWLPPVQLGDEVNAAGELAVDWVSFFGDLLVPENFDPLEKIWEGFQTPEISSEELGKIALPTS